MKKSAILFSLLTAAIGFSFVADNPCGDFEQFKTGTVFTTTNYNAKDKVESTVTSTVKSATNTATGVSATINAVMKDGKDKETMNADYTVTCEAGEVKMDMKAFAAGAASQQGKDMQLSFEGNTLNYPKTMSVGQTLPEGNMKVNMSSNGTLAMTMDIRIYDRKVEAVESKTTPAGTWQCYKISYTSEYKSVMVAMNMTIPVKPRKTIEYFNYKVGSVRTETYREDKLEGYSELTSLKKP